MLTRNVDETIRARAARELLQDISAGRNVGELPDDLISILRQVSAEADVDLVRGSGSDRRRPNLIGVKIGA
jgi:hypothetical protein